jgi:inosose dehydratase
MADYHKLAAALDRVKDLAQARSMRAHYHPHLSTIVEGPTSVGKIFDLTTIDFVPDTAHLAAAGGDPAQLIREHAKRISYVHLKGFQREPFAFTPLDRGDVPTAPILQALRDTGYQGWVCVELDVWPDAAEGARISMDYLKSH